MNRTTTLVTVPLRVFPHPASDGALVVLGTRRPRRRSRRPFPGLPPTPLALLCWPLPRRPVCTCFQRRVEADRHLVAIGLGFRAQHGSPAPLRLDVAQGVAGKRMRQWENGPGLQGPLDARQQTAAADVDGDALGIDALVFGLVAVDVDLDLERQARVCSCLVAGVGLLPQQPFFFFAALSFILIGILLLSVWPLQAQISATADELPEGIARRRLRAVKLRPDPMFQLFCGFTSAKAG